MKLRIFFLIVFFNFFLLSCENSNQQKKDIESKQPKVTKKQKLKKPAPRGLPVKAKKVTLNKISDQLNAVGSLLANESVVIRPEINGRISEIHFNEGQVVKAGQKLLSFENSEFRAQLDAVKFNLITERKSLNRMVELYEKKFISKDALDLKKGKVNSLQAKFNEFQSRLSKTVIKAPFSGIVGLMTADPISNWTN